MRRSSHGQDADLQSLRTLLAVPTALQKPLFGEGLHRLMNRESPGGQIVFTPKFITQNPRQLVAHLLCRASEERIATFGEAPALVLISRGKTFPLLDRMKLATPIETHAQFAAYSGRAMGIDVGALVYYALRLAWRGAVTEWKTLQGQTTTATLGAHKEPIRQYLAGEATVPGNVFVVLTVCSDGAAQNIVNAPWPVPTPADTYLQIEMFVRGLWFIVLVGDAVPQEQRSLSLLGSRASPIYLRDCTDQVVIRNRHFLESAEKGSI
jgi:hypothetical protein